jgi:hypothetical protein
VVLWAVTYGLSAQQCATDVITIGYVGAHGAEYLLVVCWRMRRAGDKAAAGDAVGALVRRIGTNGSIAYSFAMLALIAALHGLGGSQVAVARCSAPSVSVITASDGLILRRTSDLLPITHAHKRRADLTT